MTDPRGAGGVSRAPWRPSTTTRLLVASGGVLLAVRVLGLASQASMARTFGSGSDLDAVIIALVVPNLIASSFAGAYELRFGPLYARVRASGADAARDFRRLELRKSLMTGVAAALCLVIASRLGVFLSAPTADQPRTDLARHLALIIYPTVAPMIVSAAAGGLLYGAGSVNSPAVISAVRSAAIIGALLVSDDVDSLAAALVVASLAELAALLGVLWYRERRLAGSDPSPAALADPAVGAATPLRPLVLSVLVVQLAPAIDQAFVAGTGAGRLVTFVIAARFYDIARSILVLPQSRMAQQEIGAAIATGADPSAAYRRLERRTMSVGLVSGVGLVVAGRLLLSFAYGGGEFSAADQRHTLTLVLIFAVGVLPSAFLAMQQRVLAALQHEQTASRIMRVRMLLNVALNGALVIPLADAGIVLSTVLTTTLVAGVQARAIRAILREGRPSRVPADGSTSSG